MLTKHNNIKRILAVILAVLALVGGLYGICRAVRTARAYDVAPLTDAQLTDLDLTGITHLMIVAHPERILQTAAIWWSASPTATIPHVLRSFSL